MRELPCVCPLAGSAWQPRQGKSSTAELQALETNFKQISNNNQVLENKEKLIKMKSTDAQEWSM
jgi:hypothetical protein